MTNITDEKKRALVWSQTHKDFKGVWSSGGPWQGKKTIMSYAKYGGGLTLLDDLDGEELEERYLQAVKAKERKSCQKSGC